MVRKPDPLQLRTYPLLETLNDQDLILIGRYIRTINLEKDQALLLEGNTPTGLYFVTAGWLKAE